MTLMTRFTLWVVGALAATVMLGCSGTAENSARGGQQQRNAELVRDAFARGVSGE